MKFRNFGSLKFLKFEIFKFKFEEAIHSED